MNTESTQQQRQNSPAPKAPPVFDELTSFADWFLGRGGLPPVPYDGYNKVGAFTGATLYRDAKFQVQLWVGEPHSEIPDHTHPNIDTILVYLGGDIKQRWNGQVVLDEHMAQENGLSVAYGASLRVAPTDTHGATFGERGGVFMVFQRWLNGVTPTSAEKDWIGEAIQQ